jgi:hypothetical protein
MTEDIKNKIVVFVISAVVFLSIFLAITDIAAGTYIYSPGIVVNKEITKIFDDDGYSTIYDLDVAFDSNITEFSVSRDRYTQTKIDEAVSIKKLKGRSGIIWSQEIAP